MFGYQCESCGLGIVQPVEFKNYPTSYRGKSYTVDAAVIGVCKRCGAKHFNSVETKRWVTEYLKKKLEERNEKIKKCVPIYLSTGY